MTLLYRAVRWVNRNALPVFAVVAVVALFMALGSVVAVVWQQSERVDDQQTYDQQSCDRGNALREDIKDIGSAAGALVRGVLEEAAPNDQTLVRFEPAFQTLQEAIDAIALTNCLQAIDKAKEN